MARSCWSILLVDPADLSAVANQADGEALLKASGTAFVGTLPASVIVANAPEGVPEYTGVKSGLATPAEQAAYAIYDLSAFAQAPTFVHSFAYATGPAYGLLLDQADSAWRRKVEAGRSLDESLSAAFSMPPAMPGELESSLALYDDGAQRAQEVSRDKARRVRLAVLEGKLVDGPVLNLPLHQANLSVQPADPVAAWRVR